MISKINLRNFKSLKDVSINLSNLNIITGENGVGKSTLIQTLLLLRQAFRTNFHQEGIPLDGELTGNLGSVKDIQNSLSDTNEIEISVDECKCIFNTKNRLEDTLLRGHNNLGLLKKSALMSAANFQYISASRLSPGKEYKKNTYYIEHKQFGKNGEFSVPYLAEFGKIDTTKKKDKKYKALINLALDQESRELPLEGQVNYWLNFISDDVRLDIKKITSSRYDLNFQFFTGISWESFSAENSATGLTFVLPVITALLAASPGDLVIIENPESDLHPRAQSKIGELMARCANSGVQIIVETHSDHILNGIRVAVSQKPSLLPNEMTRIFYFYRKSSIMSTNVEVIPIDVDGRIPIRDLKMKGIDGFFDQMDKDYLTLMKNQTKS